jgi:hypothetical protein
MPDFPRKTAKICREGWVFIQASEPNPYLRLKNAVKQTKMKIEKHQF